MKINREALRTIRERSLLTQMELARLVDSSPGYINDIEAGRRNPSPKKIMEIARALDCPVVAITTACDRETA